jgi:hypothetical protein
MITGVVTGRRYKRVRVRGFAAWNPRSEVTTVVVQVEEVILEYTMALTVRQIFYRLVGKYGFEKTEQAYDRLGEYINRARRAKMIGFDSIRDDGDIVGAIPGWTGPEQFWIFAKAVAGNYFRRPDSDVYVEIWCETAGMQPQIQEIADPFGVRVIAGGGFSSTSARYRAAKRLMEMANTGKRPIILLIGDFDPSGGSIMDVLVEDVIAFGAEDVEFIRLAVTEEQAKQYNLISAPQKDTDKRGEYMPETWQAEALDPDVLAEIVKDKLTELIGRDALDKAEEQTKKDKKKILADLSKSGKGVKK